VKLLLLGQYIRLFRFRILILSRSEWKWQDRYTEK
jgi:hypothetical protein